MREIITYYNFLNKIDADGLLVDVADVPPDSSIRNGEVQDKEEGDSGIDANSQGSCSSNDVKSKEKRKDKKKKKTPSNSLKSSNSRDPQPGENSNPSSSRLSDFKEIMSEKRPAEKATESKSSRSGNQNVRKGLVFEASRHPAEREDFEATGNETYIPNKNKKSHKYVLMYFFNRIVSNFSLL